MALYESLNSPRWRKKGANRYSVTAESVGSCRVCCIMPTCGDRFLDFRSFLIVSQCLCYHSGYHFGLLTTWKSHGISTVSVLLKQNTLVDKFGRKN